jgi:NADPH:quinone reductase-like Zn-dependent oxidoreductase
MGEKEDLMKELIISGAKALVTKDNLVKVGKVAVGVAAGVVGCKAIDLAKAKAKVKKIKKAAEKAEQMAKANIKENHSEVYYDYDEACEVIEDDGAWTEAWENAYAGKEVSNEGH